MDERVEAFMKDVLGLEGENSNEVREGVRRSMAEYEKTVRNAETDVRSKVPAAQQFRERCHDRVLNEITIDRRTFADSARCDQSTRRVSN